MPLPPEFFRTPSLIFRPFDAGDLDALAAIVADPQVVRYVDEGRPMRREMAELWITRSRENVARHGYGTGALVTRSTGRLVGWAGFARPKGEPEEIIYGFEAASWGKGHGSEIARGLVDYAFGPLALREVRATVHVDNAVSQHMLRKLGFEAAPWPDPDEVLFVLDAARRP